MFYISRSSCHVVFLLSNSVAPHSLKGQMRRKFYRQTKFPHLLCRSIWDAFLMRTHQNLMQVSVYGRQSNRTLVLHSH